jgi:hypothetical protein
VGTGEGAVQARQEPQRVAPVLSYHQPQPVEVGPSTAIVLWFGAGVLTMAFGYLSWRGTGTSFAGVVVFVLVITAMGMLLFRIGARERLRWGGPRHFTLAIASGAAYVAGLLAVTELTESRLAALWFAVAMAHACGFPLVASLWCVGRAERSV